MAFFTLNVYQTGAGSDKGALVATITNVESISGDLQLQQPFSWDITLLLTDAQVASLGQGLYAEFYAGNAPQTLLANGIITDLKKSDTDAVTYVVTVHSALDALNHFRVMGQHDMRLASDSVYQNIVHALNGVQHPPSSGQYPPGYKGFLTGSGQQVNWVDPNGSSAPGAGDLFRADYDTSFSILSDLAAHYNFFIRDRIATTQLPHSATIDIGPFNDASGQVIWGGESLRQDQQTNHGLTLQHPNAFLAEQDGYAVIEDAEYEEDFSGIVNVLWLVGGGEGKKRITLQSLAGGPPLDKSGTLQTGWTAWQPYTGDRVFYIKNNSKTTYSGNSFMLIAEQQQGGLWDYGVLNQTSANQYGVYEGFFSNRKIHDPNWLLSAGLGGVEWNSTPVPRWTFTVRHPMTSTSGVPSIPLPGQQLTVHFAGMVNAYHIDGYGQIVSDGALTYMSYPGTNDNNLIAKLGRLIEVQYTWDQSGFVATYTLGRGKWKSHHWADNMARRMEANEHHRHPNHTFSKKPFDGVMFLMSSSPTCYEDQQNNALVFNPGATAVSDVPDDTFFQDHNGWSFDLNVTDAAEYMDCWFAKKVDTTLTSPNSSAPYGVLRLAFTTSGTSSGFYSTQDGVTFTSRGTTHRSPLLDANKTLAPGLYRVTIQWSGNQWVCKISSQDTDVNDGSFGTVTLATWNDKGTGGNKILSWWGAIGWKLHGGSSTCTVLNVHVHPYHHPNTTRRTQHPHAPTHHHWHGLIFKTTAWDGTHATFQPEVQGGLAALMDDKNQVIRAEDGSDVSWTSNPSAISGASLGQYVVYNATDQSVSDGTNSVAKNSFGVVNALKSHKPGWDFVFEVGRISPTVDPHSKMPWIVGFRPGQHQAHGGHVATGAVGRKHHNVHQMTKHHHPGLVYSLDSEGNSPNTATQCTFHCNLASGHTTGSIRDDKGNNVVTFTSNQFLNQCNPGDFIVYDKGTASGHTAGFHNYPNTANGGPDLTTDPYVDVFIIGVISEQPDPATGHYMFHYWQGGAHQAHSQHIADKAVHKEKQHPHTPGKHHFRDLTVSVSNSGTNGNSSTQATVTWLAGWLALHDGTDTFINNGSISQFNCGYFLVWDTSTSSMKQVSSLKNQLTYYEVGQLGGNRTGQGQDSVTGQYKFYSHHAGSTQHHGDQHALGSVSKQKAHKHNQGRHHVRDCILTVKNTGISPNTLNQCTVSWTSGTIHYDDESTASITAGSMDHVNQGAHIGWDTSANSGAGGMVALNSDVSANLTFHSLMRIGFNKDSASAQLMPHGHQHGHLQVHGDHHADSSVPKTKAHPHTPHRHHIRDAVFTCSATGVSPNTATQCTVSWTGGVIHRDDNTTVSFSSGSLTNMNTGAYVGYDTATSSMVSYLDATAAPLTWHALYRVAGVVDSNTGQLTTHAHHSGHQEAHGKHHAQKAVSSKHHLKTGHTTTGTNSWPVSGLGNGNWQGLYTFSRMPFYSQIGHHQLYLGISTDFAGDTYGPSRPFYPYNAQTGFTGAQGSSGAVMYYENNYALQGNATYGIFVLPWSISDNGDGTADLTFYWSSAGGTSITPPNHILFSFSLHQGIQQ